MNSLKATRFDAWHRDVDPQPQPEGSRPRVVKTRSRSPLRWTSWVRIFTALGLRPRLDEHGVERGEETGARWSKPPAQQAVIGGRRLRFAETGLRSSSFIFKRFKGWRRLRLPCPIKG